MKQILVGREKGYLIPKKVVEDKLREKFDVLKDKEIASLNEGYRICIIRYESEAKAEKKNDYVLIHEKLRGVTENLVFKKELLNELFGLKGNIRRINLKVIRNKTILDDCHIWHGDAEYEKYMFNNDDIYYFFEIKEYRTEDFCEMS